jgi:hypothetical protein
MSRHIPARGGFLVCHLKYWGIIAENLSKAGWSWGCVSGVDSNGHTIFVADTHRGDRTTVCDSLTLLVAACGACGACAACDGFGFARNTATTFDVFYWLQVTNFDVLLNSAPSGPDYIDIWGLCLHAQLFRSNVRLG